MLDLYELMAEPNLYADPVLVLRSLKNAPTVILVYGIGGLSFEPDRIKVDSLVSSLFFGDIGAVYILFSFIFIFIY